MVAYLFRMVVRVGINGFGRIGRVIFRTCIQNKELEVAAVNDPAVDIAYICYLIKFDSTHGKFQRNVSFLANEIIIDDKKIKVFSEKLPSYIPWQAAAVKYVIEASGMFTSLDKASGHLANDSVKRVFVTAPTVDIPMLILGVNKEQISTEQKVISCASSTLYCLAPIIKILEDNYGVAEGFVTSIHAMTPSLKPLDGLCLRGKHWRDHRSIHQNIIPAATGACKALGKIIPQVKDKMTGLAFRVPIVNVSVLDITVRLNKNTTIQDIIRCVETESKSNMRNIIKISKDQEVSSDFLGDECSCIFDVNSSLQLNPNFFKLICWYENEYSYACRVMDSIKYLEGNQYRLEVVPKTPIGGILALKRSIHRKQISYFNKEYVNSNCRKQSNSKIMFSTSQDTGFKEKPLKHDISLKKSKPLQVAESNKLSLRETGKRNEIFKVWNDEAQISGHLVKENGNSFFQSCMTLTPSIYCNNCLNTHERLVEVKKEFSKMMSMTENLLKNSNENKCGVNLLEGSTLDNELGESETKLVQGFYKTPFVSCVGKNIPANDESEASFSGIYINDLKTHLNENSDISVATNISGLNDTVNIHEIKKMETNCGVDVCSANNIASVESQRNEEISSPKANKLEIQHNVKEEICDGAVSKILYSYSDKSAIEYSTSCINSSNNFINNSDVTLVNNADSTIKIPNKSCLNHLVPSVMNVKTGSDVPDVVTGTSKKERRKKIIEEIIKKLSGTKQEVRTRSTSLINTATTISIGDCYRSLDIYDKLDSASATDSENSFQINERKSQVIDITDLTSSAEDLIRLDKICRIIEISDELSDKLFSVLDTNEPKAKKTKWTFKDLCERLKLDEFCDNVFGQSTS